MGEGEEGSSAQLSGCGVQRTKQKYTCTVMCRGPYGVMISTSCVLLPTASCTQIIHTDTRIVYTGSDYSYEL